MRQIVHQTLAQITTGGSNPNRAFLIPYHGTVLQVISSDGTHPIAEGWEHVSVSTRKVVRCPTWEEMDYVKKLFWGDEETVVQFHPRAEKKINCHPYVLHLWRKAGVTETLPPSVLI